MKSVAVVTDSQACLPRHITDEHTIGVVPINIIFRDKVYRDCVDLSPTEAYQLFPKDPEAFSTSPASPAQYIEAFREASRRARDVVCITVSSRLSTVHNVARLAGEQVTAGLPEAHVSVMDSQTVLAAQGFVALASARAAALGKDLDEVMRTAEEIRRSVSFVMVLDTIRHVYRTGRVPKVAAQAASVLSIKPVLTSSSGVVLLVGVARSMHQSIERVLSAMESRAGRSPVHVAVMHAYAPTEAEKLRERVSIEFNCAELWITEVSPAVGYALGAGALGLAYYKEQAGHGGPPQSP